MARSRELGPGLGLGLELGLGGWVRFGVECSNLEHIHYTCTYNNAFTLYAGHQWLTRLL